MKRPPRLRLDWSGVAMPSAKAPDGTQYRINSEAAHPGRLHYPEALYPIEGGNWREPGVRLFDEPDAEAQNTFTAIEEEIFGIRGCSTRAQAKRWAEVDAHRRCST